MKKLLNRSDVEQTYGISRRFLEVAAVKGHGPMMTKVGRLVFYRPEDIDEWLNANKVRSTSETERKTLRSRTSSKDGVVA